MTEVDELDINPFFKALQTKFADVYQKAEEDCNLICIPKAECLQGASMTQKFVYTHILRPSPFFKRHYTTLLSDKQTVTVDDKGQHVTTEEGFPTRVKIKVISEELCYNKEYKPYKIIIIDRPLDFNVMRKQPTDEKTQSGELKLKYSQKECKEVLQSYPEFSKQVKELDSQIGKFNHNYLLLKDYLQEAMGKLQDMFETTSENCISSIKSKSLVSHQFKDYIRGTVETYLMSSIHQKLYPVICERCRDDDAALIRKCRSLKGLTPDQLGIPEHFCCPLPSAVVELAHLDSLVTPVEKFYCLKTTFDNITEEINKHIQESQPPGVTLEDVPCLTSDDLIPILKYNRSTKQFGSKVTVIVQAKCSHIHTDIFYMENFYWSAGTKDRDNLSYCLVTFTAAVQYMMSTDFSDIDVKSKLEENEVSFQELMKSDINSVIQSPQASSSQPSSTGRARTQSRSRFDRQIDNISKMLEETTTETQSSKKSTVQAFPSLFGENIIRVSNRLDPDEAPSNSVPHLDPNCLQRQQLRRRQMISMQRVNPFERGKQVYRTFENRVDPDQREPSDQGPPSKSSSPLNNVSGREAEKKTENMGDFLSGLQDNMFLSFGKQT